jgi:hypothetical protein
MPSILDLIMHSFLERIPSYVLSVFRYFSRSITIEFDANDPACFVDSCGYIRLRVSNKSRKPISGVRVSIQKTDPPSSIASEILPTYLNPKGHDAHNMAASPQIPQRSTLYWDFLKWTPGKVNPPSIVTDEFPYGVQTLPTFSIEASPKVWIKLESDSEQPVEICLQVFRDLPSGAPKIRAQKSCS